MTSARVMFVDDCLSEHRAKIVSPMRRNARPKTSGPVPENSADKANEDDGCDGGCAHRRGKNDPSGDMNGKEENRCDKYREPGGKIRGEPSLHNAPKQQFFDENSYQTPDEKARREGCDVIELMER